MSKFNTCDNSYYPGFVGHINLHQDDDQLRFFHETQSQLLELSASQDKDISFFDLQAEEE